MDPATTAALISAGSQLVGSVIGSASTASGISATNEANLAIARENRAWQEYMDNTKYQRGVADARAAGFNPLVAFPGSAGTPMPSTPVMMNPKPNRGELFLNTAKAMTDMLLQKELIKKTQSDTDVNKKQEELLQTQKDALAGAVADSQNRKKYAESPFGKGLSWVKNTSSDIGAAVLGALGLGNTAKSLAGGSRVIKGFSQR